MSVEHLQEKPNQWLPSHSNHLVIMAKFSLPKEKLPQSLTNKELWLWELIFRQRKCGHNYEEVG